VGQRSARPLCRLHCLDVRLSPVVAEPQGDARTEPGVTLLYLLALWLVAGLVSVGASRRWALAASAISPAVVAILTLLTLAPPRIEELFLDNRLEGTIGYRNGEAAFLLVPLWVAIYLAVSRSVSPILRGIILAGAVFSVDLAVLTQSRGAMVAMVAPLPVFFLISGQRLRGLFAFAPIALALWLTFPELNAVYLAFQSGESAPTALSQALPGVWLTAVWAGLYGVLWGLMDRRWELTASVTRLLSGRVICR
jgi:hypothetical protein